MIVETETIFLDLKMDEELRATPCVQRLHGTPCCVQPATVEMLGVCDCGGGSTRRKCDVHAEWSRQGVTVCDECGIHVRVVAEVDLR